MTAPTSTPSPEAAGSGHTDSALAASSNSPAPEASSPGRALSAALFAFERSLIIAFMAMMVVSYVLAVLWNNAQLHVDPFAQLVLKIAGYPTPEATPPDVLDRVVSLWSPLALAVVLIALGYLAARTRQRSVPDETTPASPPTPVTRFFAALTAPISKIRSTPLQRLTWAILIAAGLWGLVALIRIIPASYLAFATLLLLLLAALPLLPAGTFTRARQTLATPAPLALLAAAMLGAFLPALGVIALVAALLGLITHVVPSVPRLVSAALGGFALAAGFVAFLAGQPSGFAAASLGLILALATLGSLLAGIFGALVSAAMMSLYLLTKASAQYDWTTGTTAILLLYVGFLGASMATHDGQHIGVDLVRKNLKSHRVHLYNAIGDAVALLFAAFLAVMAVRFLTSMRTQDEFHAASGLSAWVAAIPIGFAFIAMVVRFGLRIHSSLAAYRRHDPPPDLTPELQ